MSSRNLYLGSDGWNPQAWFLVIGEDLLNNFLTEISESQDAWTPQFIQRSQMLSGLEIGGWKGVSIKQFSSPLSEMRYQAMLSTHFHSGKPKAETGR